MNQRIDQTTELISDLRVRAVEELLPPVELKRKLPIGEQSARTVLESRQAIGNILGHRDPRLLAVVGPCSIHDPSSAYDYADRLISLRKEIDDVFFVVMRVYFEKPRTKLGWRGLILDPHLDGSYSIAEGLPLAREILLEITKRGMPAGSEMLDPIVPQYIDDLVSWASIGARTTESQTHREMASGLSMPVGFKNGTDGSIETALNAMASSLSPHRFIGTSQEGRTSLIHTSGNEQVHVILRGGRTGPNYNSWDIVRVEEMLRHQKLPQSIIVDCSHGNSQKAPERQTTVLRSIVEQRISGRDPIRGFMIESNLIGGRQNLGASPTELVYGQSITDACLGWEDTESALRAAAKEIRESGGLS